MDRLVVTMPTNRLNILSSFCFIIVSVLIAGCARNLGINEVEHVNSDSVEENQSNYTNLEVDDAGCIQPVNSIAYQSNYIFGVSEDQIPFPSVDTFISPTKPWHTELELPELQSDNEIVSHVEVTRTWNDQVEIWIARSSPFDIFQYDIYLPENGSWKPAVSRYVDNTDVRISMLYVLSDGSIWAKNIWSEQIESSKDYFPILSKFNEKTRQFEFVDSMQGIPGLRDFHESLVEVAVDNQDVFWILVEGDAIYSYSSHLKKIQVHSKIPEASVLGNPAIDNQGFLYFTLVEDPEAETQKLYKFDTNLSILEEVNNLRLQPWPGFIDLFGDHENRIWLGGAGWMEPDGDVYQVLQNPIFVAPQRPSVNSYRYTPPRIVEVSSDGRVWLGAQAVGLVWLDMSDDKYCWFTTYETNIEEDRNNNLWLVAENLLFKYEITQ